MRSSEKKEPLTLEGAAASLGVSLSTLWRRIRAGRLPTRRVLGRVVVDIEAIEALAVVVGGGRRGPAKGTEK